MSEQLPARHSSAPTLPTRSDNAPLDFLSQLAQRYFGNVYANDGQPPLQHEDQQPSTLQNALGYLADRALLRTSITIGSDTADAGNQEPSPLAKAADYVSRSLFAPEMLDSSSSGSSIGVTIVRPPSRSCLRSARSTINVTDAADDEPNPPKRVPRTASGSRVQYRVRLIPSSDRQRAASTQSLPPGSGPDYYVYLPGMRSWGKLLTPSASCLQCHPECSCLGPMDAYRAASAQMNPYGSFGMSSTLPFWPLPQYPYHYYSPSATVPPFQAWASGQRGTESSTDGAGSTNCVQCKWEASQWPSPHASSNCLQCKWEESQWPSPHAGSKCVQCRWEAGQWPSSPAGAFRDFSTLVQAANQGQSSAVHDFSTLVQTALPGSRRAHTTHNLVTLADVPEEMDGGAEGAAVDPLVVVLKWPGFAEAPAAQGLARPPTSNPEGPNAVPWAEQIASQSHLQDPAQVDTSALQAQKLQTNTAPRVQQGVTAPPMSEPQGAQPAQPLPVAQLPGGVFGSGTGPMAEVAAPGKGNGPTDTAAAAAVEDSELHDSPSHDSPSHESESHESASYLSGSQGSTSSGGIANQVRTQFFAFHCK
ncbi:hypothetical protein HPB48_020868 [Haemaphysalis longicornis]|uniref:Uncharacterized protein n=1 Tax=Haemaphysalis longicornis TaxID=44386 RepID=A0A9J6FL65_HAELO|nr:hypothetical protein HPB48_020868 [Haemaphysalis longicornis]